MKKDIKNNKQESDLKLFVSAFSFIFVAFVFYASKILSPFHLPIALVLLFFGAKKCLTIYRTHFTKYEKPLSKKLTVIARHKKAIIFLLSISFLIYTYTSIIPTDKEVFTYLNKEETKEIIDNDMILAAQFIDMISVTGEQLLSNPAIHKKDLTVAEQDALRQDWNNFLEVAIASEKLTDTHRYFAQIPIFGSNDLHTKSFTISYSLYMKKFEYFHKIISSVGSNGEVRTALNEYYEPFGSKNSYDEIANRYFATNSFMRRNLGYLYHKIINPDLKKVSAPEYKILIQVANDSYSYIFKNAFSHLTHRTIYYTNALNDTIDGSWLPIQKTVFVDTIGNIHVGDRIEKFITIDDIATMKKSLAPGDIFVARKNWYASNVGIPGFWTHTGLYTGTLEDMEKYFSDIFPYTKNDIAYNTLEELLSENYKEALNTYKNLDSYGYKPSVIESETKGTNIHSIEYSASVDYFGVMRPNLTKADILESILRTLPHQHKPYDYEFSLITKDEIFCSELIYDAYSTLDHKSGLTFPTSVTAGKEIVSPNDIVKKFIEEESTPNQQLSFVYFLDGNEADKKAYVSGKEAFIASYERPKFSLLQK